MDELRASPAEFHRRRLCDAHHRIVESIYSYINPFYRSVSDGWGELIAKKRDLTFIIPLSASLE